MAGGNADLHTTPYPKGEDGLFPLVFAFNALASKSADWITAQVRVQFAFKAVRAELTAEEIAITNAITLNLQDDTGTPQELLTDVSVTAISGGGGGRIDYTSDLDKDITVNAGALLELSYGSGSSDTVTNGLFILWVKPVY
jgi:hypothetical protein